MSKLLGNYRVANHSRLIVEHGKKVKCPRCHGFGATSKDEHDCGLCRGRGIVIRSNSGWTRPLYCAIENSQLY